LINKRNLITHEGDESWMILTDQHRSSETDDRLQAGATFDHLPALHVETGPLSATLTQAAFCLV
jgi:hypothetical protein